MLNQFLEKFNEKLDYFKKSISNNKKSYKNSLFLFIVIILFLLDNNIINLTDFSLLNLYKSHNFFYLTVFGGLFYIISIIFSLKISFFLLIYYFFFFTFFDTNVSYIYEFLLNLQYNFKNNNFYNLKILYDHYLYNIELNYNFFESEYLNSKKFKKILILNSNLPLFFYFCTIFVITTLSSFLLLSYLGLYGVFIINLISIVLFWISSILYFNSFYIDNCFYKFSLGK